MKKTYTIIVLQLLCVLLLQVGCAETQNGQASREIAIEGVQPCKKQHQTSVGSVNSQVLHIFLVENNRALSLENFDLSLASAKKLKVMSEPKPLVYDADDGSILPEVKVKLGVEHKKAPITFSNPVFFEKYLWRNPEIEAKGFLLDFGEKSSTTFTQISGLADWLPKWVEPEDALRSQNAIDVLLMRNNQITTKDYILKNELNVYEAAHILRSLSKKDQGGKPPFSQAIEFMADSLRKKYNQKGVDIMATMITIISGEDLILSSSSSLERASKALQGKRPLEEIPLMIIYPHNSSKSVDRAKNIEQLCKLTHSHYKWKGSKEASWGKLFQIWPWEQKKPSRIQALLNTASHAARGYIEISVSYQLTGVQKGKRYIISFALELEGTKSIPSKNVPRIRFQVTIPK